MERATASGVAGLVLQLLREEIERGKSKSKSPSHYSSPIARGGLHTLQNQDWTGLRTTNAHKSNENGLERAQNVSAGFVQRCDVRESNPGQLLGRQLCSPLYQHRLVTTYDQIHLLEESYKI